MSIKEMKTKNGYFEQDEENYILCQQAYRSTDRNEGVFEAMAIKENDKKDEDGWQTAFRVYWKVTDNNEDESYNADWDSPYSVEKIGEYNIEQKSFY